MPQLKFIVIIGSIAGIIIIGAMVYLQQTGILHSWWNNLSPKGDEFIEIQPSPPKRVDKLFTSFVYMPLLDYKKDEATIKGLCARQYEVGIGYNDIWKLFEQHQEAACRNDLQKMPEPEILSTNTVLSELYGGYYQQDCDLWDQTNPTEPRRSHVFILEKLRQNGQWGAIVENSQRILTGYLRIYCPEILSENK